MLIHTLCILHPIDLLLMTPQGKDRMILLQRLFDLSTAAGIAHNLDLLTLLKEQGAEAPLPGAWLSK